MEGSTLMEILSLFIPVWVIACVINAILVRLVWSYAMRQAQGDIDLFTYPLGCAGSLIVTLLVWMVYFMMEAEGVF